MPCQLTSFIGREREMAEIKQLLSSTSLLTLTGSGGCGKTRLALQVAADLLEEYPDGVWVVELAALSDPALVPQAVASTLDVREQPSRALMDTLTDYLKPKVLMLILDNCEHLLAACSQLADTLLRACPHLRILASSREGLGIAGEITWRVPSLAMPDSQRLPPMESLTQYEAVRLFIERAVAVLPTFQVTNPNAPAVAQICHRLDGIPLAIELAATRVKALSVEEIAVRLDDRFRLLIGGSRTALPRQQTLRAAIDWSFDLLSAVERILLCRLSVFAGGCTLEAAEEVCSGERIQKDEILDLVTHLVDKSLVWAQQHGGQTRYLLLETVRQYARDKLLEVGDSAHVRNHHLDYYLKLAERAEPHLVDSQSLIWLEQLDWDYDNLRVAMEWASGSNQTEAGLGIAGALGEFWFVRGYFSEGRRWLDALLSKGKGASASARAPALRTAGSMAWSQGDYSQTAAFYEEALALSRGLGDKRGIAWSLLGLGDAA
ncbi:AAA family ATPase [Candidatus Acetothermia bacterium]|nr:AAA family ATPase [Candidatus Acetothermia bacterium]